MKYIFHLSQVYLYIPYCSFKMLYKLTLEKKQKENKVEHSMVRNVPMSLCLN